MDTACDLLGTTYSSSSIATGYGAYIAIPLLRTAVDGREDTLTEEEARKIIEDCMRVLYYRDARSIDKVCLHILRTKDCFPEVIPVSTGESHRGGGSHLGTNQAPDFLGIRRRFARLWCSDAVGFPVFLPPVR